MAEFQEDMLFKNVSDKDASILLDIMGIKSKRTKVWTKELRHIDPINYKPDLILDLEKGGIVDFSDPIFLTEYNKANLGEIKYELYAVINFSELKFKFSICLLN